MNYQEFEANDWNKQISKINGWGGNATIIHTSLQGQQENNRLIKQQTLINKQQKNLTKHTRMDTEFELQ